MIIIQLVKEENLLTNKEWDIIRYITEKKDRYIGDDCAVWEEFGLVVTTDHMCEGTHFDLSFMPPESVGWRLMAANASDIISMGSVPTHFLLNIAAPSKDLTISKKIIDGVNRFADKYSIDILGGDTTSASSITVGVTMFGKKPERPLLRSSAKPGDLVYICEPLGLSRCGLYHLKNGNEGFDESKNKFLYPDPFTTSPKEFKDINCAIDISDALISELELISKASDVSIEINLESVPIHPEVTKTADIIGVSVEQMVFTSGEEFSLIVTSKEKLKGLYNIGFIKDSGKNKIEIISKDAVTDSSSFSVYDHFSR